MNFLTQAMTYNLVKPQSDFFFKICLIIYTWLNGQFGLMSVKESLFVQWILFNSIILSLCIFKTCTSSLLLEHSRFNPNLNVLKPHKKESDLVQRIYDNI